MRRRFIQTWWVNGKPYNVNQMELRQLTDSLKQARETLAYIKEKGCSPAMHKDAEVAVKTFERKVKKKSLMQYFG